MSQENIQSSQNIIIPQKLSFGRNYNHFFLVHDFLHKLTKTKAKNNDFFELQLQIYNGMKRAVDVGAKVSQFLSFGSLCLYYFKGKSIGMKFITGFVFMYWYNHIITLGTYLGAFCRMPSLYNKTLNYYSSHPQQKDKYMQKMEQYLNNSAPYNQTQVVLFSMFQNQIEDKSFVQNEFFVKNKEKYIPKEVLDFNPAQNLKLTYMDSFLTRYIYYSFTRWCDRMKMFITSSTQSD